MAQQRALCVNPLGDVVGCALKQVDIEQILAVLDGQRVNLAFNQVLEEVRAQRGFGGHAGNQAGHLHQRLAVENVGVVHVHPQVGVGCSPAPRPNANKAFLLQGGVGPANGAFQLVPLSL